MSDYPNSGIMNPNKYHRSGSKAPNANGKCVVTCKHCQQETEFELAAWERAGSKGPFTALKFTEKSEAERKKAERQAAKSGMPMEGQTPPPAAETTKPEGDDIPF